VLFALAATIPVVLTAVVWLAVSGWGAGPTTSEATLAATRIEELDDQRVIAVRRLCRDDLAVDALLKQRASETPAELDYTRLFHGVTDAAGLDALWIVDGTTGDVVARGHQEGVLGRDGSELLRQARDAGDESFALLLGSQGHQRFVVNACSIARGGARLVVIGGHRVSTLRALDPDQIVVVGAASDGDVTLTELVDSNGVTQGTLVWRSRLDRRAPPLLLWIACAISIGGFNRPWTSSPRLRHG
jgi:hypothetical protein